MKSPMPLEDNSGSALQAQRNKRRPQTAWGLLLALLCGVGIAGAWTGIAFLVIAYRRAMAPADAFLFSGTRLGNILAFVAPGFPSLIIGLLAGNFLVWSIPPARAALGGDAPGARGHGFRSSQLALAKFGAAVSAVALPLCFLGANNFWALAPDRIDYRTMLSATARHYSWSSVAGIETGCSTGKSTSYHFAVVLNDKTHMDLMEEAPSRFVAAYPRIQLALRGNNYGFNASGLVGSCVARAPRRWLEILTRRPTE